MAKFKGRRVSKNIEDRRGEPAVVRHTKGDAKKDTGPMKTSARKAAMGRIIKSSSSRTDPTDPPGKVNRAAQWKNLQRSRLPQGVARKVRRKVK